MPAALRVMDMTNHGGTVAGPGVPTVLIGRMPAAVIFDNHICSLPAAVGHPPVSPFPVGSATVFIGGKPALRVTDACICGAMGVIGEPTVNIGG